MDRGTKTLRSLPLLISMLVSMVFQPPSYIFDISWSLVSTAVVFVSSAVVVVVCLFVWCCYCRYCLLVRSFLFLFKFSLVLLLLFLSNVQIIEVVQGSAISNRTCTHSSTVSTTL